MQIRVPVHRLTMIEDFTLLLGTILGFQHWPWRTGCSFVDPGDTGSAWEECCKPLCSKHVCMGSWATDPKKKNQARTGRHDERWIPWLKSLQLCDCADGRYQWYPSAFCSSKLPPGEDDRIRILFLPLVRPFFRLEAATRNAAHRSGSLGTCHWMGCFTLLWKPFQIDHSVANMGFVYSSSPNTFVLHTVIHAHKHFLKWQRNFNPQRSDHPAISHFCSLSCHSNLPGNKKHYHWHPLW